MPTQNKKVNQLIKAFIQKSYDLADLAIQLYNEGIYCDVVVKDYLQKEEPALLEIYNAALKVTNL